MELKRFTNIDADYNMAKFHKRNVLYRALPLEIQKEVDSVSARSNSSLEDYDNFIDFVVNLSGSWQYQRHALPKPLSTNIVEEKPIAPSVEVPIDANNAQYSFEEWSHNLRLRMGSNMLSVTSRFQSLAKKLYCP